MLYQMPYRAGDERARANEFRFREAAVSLASYPEEIRGFGSVKEETVARVQVQVKVLRARLIGLQAAILAGVA